MRGNETTGGDRDELLHWCRGPRRNHLCQLLWLSLMGFERGGGGSNFGFLYWLASSSLQRCRTTVLVCDWTWILNGPLAKSKHTLCGIVSIRGNETTGGIVTNFCTGVGVHDVITSANFYDCRLWDLSVVGGQILGFSVDLRRRPYLSHYRASVWLNLNPKWATGKK